jgi:hypothetical protein
MELTFGCEVIVAGIEKDNPGCEHDVVVDDRKDEHGRIGMGYFGHVHPDDFQEIIGHPINLQDWLGVLGEMFAIDSYGNTLLFNTKNDNYGLAGLRFDLTTGQPATEADYLAFNEIVDDKNK